MKHNTKLLFLIGAIAPLNSTNANLMLKIILPLSMQAEVHVLSVGEYTEEQTSLELFPDHPVTVSKYSTRTKKLYTAEGSCELSAAKKYARKIAAKIMDSSGYGDAFDGLLLQDLIEQLDRSQHYSAICSCTEPYRCAYAMYRARTGGKKFLYLIDPPAQIVPSFSGAVTPFRSATSRKLISSSDLLITTPRIVSALEAAGYDLSGKPVTCTEFPLFAPLQYTPGASSISFDPAKINLLYCGWLRNEGFLLEILKQLDDRFCVTFVGNGSQKLPPIETGAQLRTYPAISHCEAVNAILDADILLCIGNPYPVHIPSKIFEYIASGKPIIDLHTLPDCPTLTYTEEYPLALNLCTTMPPADAANRVVEFCLSSKGRSISPDILARLYHAIDSDRIIHTICTNILCESR